MEGNWKENGRKGVALAADLTSAIRSAYRKSTPFFDLFSGLHYYHPVHCRKLCDQLQVRHSMPYFKCRRRPESIKVYSPTSERVRVLSLDVYSGGRYLCSIRIHISHAGSRQQPLVLHGSELMGISTNVRSVLGQWQ
jgi:hypothetical protein